MSEDFQFGFKGYQPEPEQIHIVVPEGALPSDVSQDDLLYLFSRKDSVKPAGKLQIGTMVVPFDLAVVVKAKDKHACPEEVLKNSGHVQSAQNNGGLPQFRATLYGHQFQAAQRLAA